MRGIILVGLVCIVIASIGLWNNERDRDLLEAEYSMLLLFAAGIFGMMILAGAIFLVAGKGGMKFILPGVIGTIIFELPWLKSSKVGPVKEWMRCTLWGIGKVFKFFLCWSIIGIIPLRMIQNNIATLDEIDKRAEAQFQKDWNEEFRRQMELEELNAELKEKRRKNRK